MKTFARLRLGMLVGLVAVLIAEGPVFAQYTPFYQSTPTGRRDDNGVPSRDRFGMPESSTTIGISIPLGGPTRGDEESDLVRDPPGATGEFRLSGAIRGEELESAVTGLLRAAKGDHAVPPELSDPAFDLYVDLSSVGAAWRAQDAARLTDVALQILDGERILMRPHEHLPATQLLLAAAKLAADKKDDVTLARLKQAAERFGEQQLAAQLKAANKLAASARGEEGLSVSIENTSPGEYQAYYEYLRQIRTARILGEAAALDELRVEIGSDESLEDRCRNSLLAQIKQANAGLPQSCAPAEAVAALQKLGAASRSLVQTKASMPTKKRASHNR